MAHCNTVGRPLNLAHPDNSAPRGYRFGPFELDLAAYRLTREGEPIALERRPFDLLVLLVTRQGQLVPRDEIVARLWPERVVIDFEAGVNTLIRKIRQALGDSRDQPTFVETVTGRGYRFIAPVEALHPEAAPAEPPAQEPTPGMERTRFGRRGLWAASLLSLLIAIGLGAWSARVGDEPLPRIAILPFEDRTGDPQLGYLAAGLAEEVSASLGRIENDRLRVLGAATAKTLAASGPALSSTGRELGVDWIVRSSLQAEGSRIRVNTSLIRVRDDEQIWSAAFDRELIDLLGLQRELSIGIAEQIRLRLSPEVAAQVTHRQTLNPRAYEYYLRGRDLWGRFTPPTNREAIRHYELAVQEDPTYALAWAGMAQALAIAPMTTDADPAAIAQAAEDAVQHAMQYGPDLAEVQYSQAYVQMFLEWDIAAAEQAARAAVQLDPNSALAHMFLGVVLAQMNQDVEALAMMRRARELDPLWAQPFALSSMAAVQAGDYVAAAEFARQAIAISPRAWVGYLHLGRAQTGLGDLDAALQTFTTARRLSGNNSKAVASYAHVLAAAGRTAEARELLNEFERRSALQYVPPYAIAVILAGLGDIDAAFEWLDRAVAVRDVHVLGMHRDLHLAALAGDPRFQQILDRCGCSP